MKFKKVGGPKKRLAHYLFFIILILLIFRGPLEGVKKGAEKLFFPVKSMIYTKTNDIKEGIKNVKNYKIAMNENKNLRVEVAKLEILRNRNEYLEEENSRLRKLLEMRKSVKRSFKVAKVNFRDSITYHENIYIDLGSNQGIEENMVVLSEKNLIGRVKEVHANDSLVELLTKNDIYTSVLSEQHEVLGVLKGNNSEILSLDNVSVDKKLEVGEKLYTSGISDIYPKGLYIGEIAEIQETEDQLFKEVTVKQDFNIFDLNEIIIMEEE